MRLPPPIEPMRPRREPLFAWFEWAFFGLVAAGVAYLVWWP